MNTEQVKKLHELATEKNATARFMFGNVYELKVNGQTYQCTYYDCIKILRAH